MQLLIIKWEFTPRHQSEFHISRYSLLNGIGDKAYLWCQVEPQIRASGKSVLNQEWHIWGQAKLDSSGETRSLAKVDKVLQRESESDWVGKINIDVQVWLLDVLMGAESDSTLADVSISGELDTVLVGLDGDWRLVRNAVGTS